MCLTAFLTGACAGLSAAWRMEHSSAGLPIDTISTILENPPFGFAASKHKHGLVLVVNRIAGEAKAAGRRRTDAEQGRLERREQVQPDQVVFDDVVESGAGKTNRVTRLRHDSECPILRGDDGVRVSWRLGPTLSPNSHTCIDLPSDAVGFAAFNDLDLYQLSKRHDE